MTDFPDCPRDTPTACRFQQGPVISTAMYFEPIYDRAGNNLNPDMNSRSCAVTCATCGAQWQAAWRGSEAATYSLTRPATSSPPTSPSEQSQPQS